MSGNIWNEIANKYERLWVQKYSLAPTRKKIVELIREFKSNDNFKLLDIGCGTGQLIGDLIKICPSAEYTGIDKSSAMIKMANGKNLPCTFLEQDAININFNANTFDFITCCHSFPYYHNKTAIVENIYRVLKNGGTAIFIQASINNLYDRIVMAVVEKTAEKADYLSIVD